jgi:uncharacterized protein YndB with AHSA1/START domain
MRLLYVLFAATLAMAESPVHVTKVRAPHKALIFEVTIPASIDDVWIAFTTSEGLSTWLSPGAVVDSRPGGGWIAHYPGGKTGGGYILTITRKSEIVMSAMAPESFPHVRAERTRARFEFKEVDKGSTLVRLTQTGWKEGEEWDKAYDYLAGGNAEMLEALKRRFVSGPIDWDKEWGTSK